MRNVILAIGLLASTSAYSADVQRFERSAIFIVSGEVTTKGPPYGAKPILSECVVEAPSNVYTGRKVVKFREVVPDTVSWRVRTLTDPYMQMLETSWIDIRGEKHTLEVTPVFNRSTIELLKEAWTIVLSEFCQPLKKSIF